ncbi:MAG: hypothetical protein GY841_20590 [FCB group bacterium]|nr:hypothetical protein [FCB group bacterium]
MKIRRLERRAMTLTNEQIQTKFDTITGVSDPTWSQLKPGLLTIAKPRTAERLDIPLEEVQNSQIIECDLFGGRYDILTIHRALRMVNALKRTALTAALRVEFLALDLDDYVIDKRDDGVWEVTLDG